jgi:uncharacterized protein (DUF58 family)
MLLVAINFENSLVYGFTFWLLGIFIVSILHTFFNLDGLQIKGYDAKPCFAGCDATFEFALIALKRARYDVTLSWQNIHSERVYVANEKQFRQTLRYRTGPRGLHKPGRIKIESSYPLGLVRCWTWADLDQHVIVYPNPDQDAANSSSFTRSSVHSGEHSEKQQGSDDFYGLKDFQPGDNLKSVAWKLYAKTDKLNVKQFIDFHTQRLWLDWNNTSGNVEQRLSQLCRWALDAESGVIEYGLNLPNQTIDPDKGDAHLHAVLKTLAMFEQADANDKAKPSFNKKQRFEAAS